MWTCIWHNILVRTYHSDLDDEDFCRDTLYMDEDTDRKLHC